MIIAFYVEVDLVEEDADQSLVQERIQRALEAALPFHTCTVKIAD